MTDKEFDLSLADGTRLALRAAGAPAVDMLTFFARVTCLQASLNVDPTFSG
jgi:hypothetical protein